MQLTAETTVINDQKLNTNITDAQNTANSAKLVADNTAQYFWFTSTGTDTGAHISEKTQAQFISSPSGGNLLARSNGIAVRDGLTELATFGGSGSRIGKLDGGHATIETDGLHVWKGVETAANNEVATFTNNGASIATTSGNYITDFEIYNQNDIAYISTSARSNYALGGFIIKNTSGVEDIDAALSLSSAYSSALASALEVLLSISASNGLKLVVSGNEKFSVSNQGVIGVGGNKLLTVADVSKTGMSISANSTTSVTFSAAKTGYTPIGVVGYDWEGTGRSHFIIYDLYIDGSNVVLSFGNENNTARSNISITVKVLYIASGQGI